GLWCASGVASGEGAAAIEDRLHIGGEPDQRGRRQRAWDPERGIVVLAARRRQRHSYAQDGDPGPRPPWLSQVQLRRRWVGDVSGGVGSGYPDAGTALGRRIYFFLTSSTVRAFMPPFSETSPLISTCSPARPLALLYGEGLE